MNDLIDNPLKEMYGSQPKTKKPGAKSKGLISAKSSRDMVVIESNGEKLIVPTNTVFTELLREHQIVKNDLRKIQSELKTLKEAYNKLAVFSNNLSESIENKIDKPDSHD